MILWLPQRSKYFSWWVWQIFAFLQVKVIHCGFTLNTETEWKVEVHATRQTNYLQLSLLSTLSNCDWNTMILTCYSSFIKINLQTRWASAVTPVMFFWGWRKGVKYFNSKHYIIRIFYYHPHMIHMNITHNISTITGNAYTWTSDWLKL